MFKSYIAPDERREADRKLPRLMVEGLLLGGSGMGVLALIFEIAADAFSVAAYQTLLAIHGAAGYHDIAIMAFVVLSIMLYFGIVPAYKAGAYLRPNAGGSGPLVEAIGPARLRFLSWAGASLFFIDAILTIIISSISAADVTMLFLPQLADVRILLAEVYAFFIMAVLVALGPKRAVPLFLLGGGAFTIFTIFALGFVGVNAALHPEWAILTDGIVHKLEVTGVAEHVVRVQQDIGALSLATMVGLFFRSMSSAMLGFSGYEVIPASGKHAARPKWKVINTAPVIAAIFLIGTGIFQLFAAKSWNIPATEGYSTLLIEYEIVAAQTLGNGIDMDNLEAEVAEVATFPRIREEAFNFLELQMEEGIIPRLEGEELEAKIDELARAVALAEVVERSLEGTGGQVLLTVAGALLAIILLLAQGGGYVGGAAVAANAARLGRLPGFFKDDRIGIAVIWGIAAMLIPIIREVVVVESYYAFGFVSAFVITSTTVYLVRKDVLEERGIKPGSPEARSLRFAGLRGMIASYVMAIVLVTQKTEALLPITIAAALITAAQIYISRGGWRLRSEEEIIIKPVPGTTPSYVCGWQRALDEARQRGVADAVNELIDHEKMVKFNVEPQRIRRLVMYLHNISPEYMYLNGLNGHHEHGHERAPEPSRELEAAYMDAYNRKQELLDEIEFYSHYGIFTFVDKYYHNWVNLETGRDATVVQRAMLGILFPLTDPEEIWRQYREYRWGKQPEPIWQFARERYRWAKDQWPNLSDRITTIWTLQDLGLVDKDLDIKMVISVSAANDLREVDIHMNADGQEEIDVREVPSPKPDDEGEDT
ncbi:MAG: hypothetical protein D6712_02740 [Chloroflexi bacterium]|nr:MAG: hypothetical protein D6712_02740 [Chloroflexota bacterium]